MRFLSVIGEFLKLVFYPILVVQGRIVRKNVIELSEAKGARQGRVGQGKEIRILILGDSSACGVGVEHMRDSLVGQILRFLTKLFSIFCETCLFIAFNYYTA